MRAPRYTYFALLIPEIRENLVELALDDQQLAETEEKDWWLEEETTDEADSFLPQGPIRWFVLSYWYTPKLTLGRHWPIDLVHIQSMIAKPHKALSTSISPPALRLILHLSAPPNDKLLMPNSIDACKTQYINQLKEADFVRWRNTNKVTNLRKADLDGGWEGLVSGEQPYLWKIVLRLC
jgi:autophagy-related protein 5